jgi:membrane protease YdiL (CAAX protease family)
VVGGGFTEELQRAFVLTRFERAFGKAGLVVALLIDSDCFGVGHLYQGYSGAVSAGITGLLLGLVFLHRRRVADAMVAHAGYDLIGVAAAYALYARGP